MYDMPSANRVWGEFLRSQGFVRRGMNNGQGGRDTYGYDSGNSYCYPRIYPIYTDNGYSRHGDKEEIKKELKKMMEESTNEQMRKSISEILNRM